MGRRARRAAKPAKAKPKLDTQFDCPYCGNQRAVEIHMKRPESLGSLKCRVCGVAYQTRVNYLMEPVDVYSEWIDEAAERQAILDKQKKLQNSASAKSVMAAEKAQAAAGVPGDRTAPDKRLAADLEGLDDDDDELNLGENDRPAKLDEFQDEPEF